MTDNNQENTNIEKNIKNESLEIPEGFAELFDDFSFSKLKLFLKHMNKAELVMYLFMGTIMSGFLFALLVYVYFTIGLPDISKIIAYEPDIKTKVYDVSGEIIGEFHQQRRTVVEMDEIPELLPKAFIAVEDAKFYSHGGIDVFGIIRCLIKNATSTGRSCGGSTITQQVAKNFFLSPERTYSRKIREVILSHRIERNLTKNEIMHRYLNQIYFGEGSYGVQEASRVYFGKDVDELTLAEMALIAGLPKAPSHYSPYKSMEKAKNRQNHVLTRMLEVGFITKIEAEDATMEEIDLNPLSVDTLWAGPHFTEHVRRYVENKYGSEVLYNGGLHIYTTMDVNMQRLANDAIKNGLAKYDKRHGFRGALKHFDNSDDIAEFTERAIKKLKRRPIEVDKTYKGLITQLDSEEEIITVFIGDKYGTIKKKDYNWARKFNPTTDNPDGSIKIPVLKLLNVGDIILVKVHNFGEEETDPMELTLEQEPIIEGALLAMEPQTGFVRAMVGGQNYSKSQFNRAIQAKRQPGSSFKPVIYSAALDKGYTTATVVIDAPLVFRNRIEKVKEPEVANTLDELSSKDEDLLKAAEAIEADKNEFWEWKPKNYGQKFYGPTTIRTAVSKSRNVVTIKVLNDIGVDYAATYAVKLGIKEKVNKDLSMALGATAVTLEEMVDMFATFANKGDRPEPIYILKIADRNGNILEDNTPKYVNALTPQTAYLMTSLLESVVQSGTSRRAKALNRPAAGKTGTTNGLNDAWFLGFVPDLVAGVWVGYDSEMTLGKRETGSSAALPLWVEFMKGAIKGTEVKNFEIPEGLEFAKIDPISGKLATPRTKDPIFEVFLNGTAPTEYADDPETTRDYDFGVDNNNDSRRPVMF